MQNLFFLAGRQSFAVDPVAAIHVSELIRHIEPFGNLRFRKIDDPVSHNEIELLVAGLDDLEAIESLTKRNVLYTRWGQPNQGVGLKTIARVSKALHVIVPTEWHKAALSRYGMKVPVTVLPMGVRPRAIKHDVVRGKFTFGIHLSPKYLQSFMRHFVREFNAIQSVELQLVVDQDYQPGNKKKVHVRHYVDEDFFDSIDCLVELHGNEYWASMALASGRSVIAPRHGPLESINFQYSIPFKEVDGNPDFNWPLLGSRMMTIHDELKDQGHHTLRLDHKEWSDHAAEIMKICSESRVEVLRGGNKEKFQRTCIVQLGRYGDIMNALPIAANIRNREGVKPVFMVAKQFASILEGVSYVEPHVFEGEFCDLTEAMEIATLTYQNVVNCQIYGTGAVIDMKEESFAMESWRQAGFLQWWEVLPLIIDQRSADREKALVDLHIGTTGRRIMLVNFSGTSSPFDGKRLMEDLKFRWDHLFKIVDLSDVVAERIFDLLGLMDQADLLITSDTSTLHLAREWSLKEMPFIALVASGPTLWHGSEPRGNCILKLRYNDVDILRQEIHHAIFDRFAAEDVTKRLVHIWTDYPCFDIDRPRRDLALSTWKTGMKTCPVIPIPILNEQLPRLFDDGKRKLPFVKDVIEFAYLYSGRFMEIIVLTNSDICFSPSAYVEILTRMGSGKNCAYGYRRDFKELTGVLTDKEISKGEDYCGTDVFIFRRQWWKEHGSKFPDMLMGCEAWDPVMRQLMHETDSNCFVLRDLFYHQRHDSVWEKAENRYTLASQIHNLTLAKKFFSERNIDAAIYGIT